MTHAPYRTFAPRALALAIALAASAAFAQQPPAGAPQQPPALPKPAADAGATIATVNGKDIPKARADILVRERAQQGQADSPQLRQAIKDDLISREVIVQEAERRGMTRNLDIAQQMELARQQIVLRAFLQEWSRSSPVTDDQLKAEYDRVKSQMGGAEYKARHILVDKEDEAREIIAKLKAGGKFEELAKASKDPGSKDSGGELGWSSPGTFVKPFSDAMVKLKKGETVAAPVQSQFGWHVIRLDDTREMKHPPFEEVKPQIQQRVQQQNLEKLVADLRSKAKIQ